MELSAFGGHTSYTGEPRIGHTMAVAVNGMNANLPQNWDSPVQVLRILCALQQLSRERRDLLIGWRASQLAVDRGHPVVGGPPFTPWQPSARSPRPQLR